MADAESLRAAYCPPLDDALFYAIASEYDLPRDGERLRAVLDSLKASAFEQENSGFDPSGTGGFASLRPDGDSAPSTAEDTLSNAVTSITTGHSDRKWKGSDNTEVVPSSSPPPPPTTWLGKLFPDVPSEQLAKVLEDNEGSLDRATDELLNLAFLSLDDAGQPREEGPVLRGIEAFAEDAHRGRKGRKKRRTRQMETSRAISASSFASESESGPVNAWSSMSADVEFISTRTGLLSHVVRSSYHENGARLGPTIRALATKKGAALETRVAIDPQTEIQLADLRRDFELVPLPQIHGLLVLARNEPAVARELLKAMTMATEIVSTGTLHGVAQYVPLDLKENESVDRASTSDRVLAPSPAQASAAHHRLAADQHFGAAAAAYRRSKSDRLRGGVAAYYAELGRERAKAAREAQAVEADHLVARQSSTHLLDLHGVGVQDAIRIAGDQVQLWWDSLGDAKYAPGAAITGFRIVTGVGAHSVNHTPRIGPAVSKRLLSDGWKIEVGHGQVTVVGKRRR